MKLKRAEVKEIITDVDNLCVRCDEINTITQHEEMQNIVRDIKATMKANNLRFLSAPAIGYNKRIFCIDDPNEPEIKTYINPMPGRFDQNNLPTMQIVIEECSSFPGMRFLRFRSDRYVLQYQRPNGNPVTKEFVGIMAAKVQHEMEHLDGIPAILLGVEIDDDWEKMSEEEKAEFIMEYKNGLDIAAEKLNADINSDENATELNKGIDFMTKVASGEVKLEKI